jgi:hypothetical protein
MVLACFRGVFECVVSSGHGFHRLRKKSHFVIPNGVCGVRNLSFFAAPFCNLMS